MAATKKNKQAKTASAKKSSHSDICFVIMPFGGWFDSYYTDIYCPAIERAGLTPRRADDLYRPSNIVQDIWDLTKKAKIILADLTHKNANVFYELGLAHALAKPAILITETIDDIPFDLRSLRIIEYDKNEPDWGSVLIENIKGAIKETLASPNETIPTAFLETKRSDIETPQITKQDKEFLELKQEIELIKRQVTIPASSPSKRSSYPAIKQVIHDLRLAGASRSYIINKIANEFSYSRSHASRIVQEVIHESNDPVEPIG